MDGFRLQQDNKTWWNSWFKSIERVLKLKQALQVYCDEECEFRAECFFPEDWDMLTEMWDFLKLFHDTTLGTEGIFDAVDKVFPAMEYFLEHLETWRRRYHIDSFLGKRIDRAWQKLTEYYDLTDETIAYTAATALNPLYKWNWFQKKWSTPELAVSLCKAKAALKDLWNTNYRHLDTPMSIATHLPRVTASERIPNGFNAWLQESLDSQMMLDEFQLFESEWVL